jgi:hypothetical protein
MSVNCSTLSSSCHFFCHLLESGLARINWIRAVVKICVEQLICCQKCRANGCRAIAIRAVHPHSLWEDITNWNKNILYDKSNSPFREGWRCNLGRKPLNVTTVVKAFKISLFNATRVQKCIRTWWQSQQGVIKKVCFFEFRFCINWFWKKWTIWFTESWLLSSRWKSLGSEVSTAK